MTASRASGCCGSSVLNTSDHSPSYLVKFDRFEQRAEITLADAGITLALNDLEEYRTNRVLGEDLQQDAAVAAAVDQDPALGEAGEVGELGVPAPAVPGGVVAPPQFTSAPRAASSMASSRESGSAGWLPRRRNTIGSPSAARRSSKSSKPKRRRCWPMAACTRLTTCVP